MKYRWLLLKVEPLKECFEQKFEIKILFLSSLKRFILTKYIHKTITKIALNIYEILFF